MLTNKDREARVEKLLSKWKPRLMLDGWAIITEYAEKDNPGEDLHVLAQVTVNPVYTEARITIFPIFFKEPHGQQVSTIVHELCHIHMYKVQAALDAVAHRKIMTQKHVQELYESATEQMSKMVIKSYTRGRKGKGYHL